MKPLFYTYSLLLITLITHCKPAPDPSTLLVDAETFRMEHEGKQIDLFTIKNSRGMMVQVTNYGAKIVSVIVPDKDGKFADVCLGYETAQQYLDGVPSMGATIGRFANRIAGGQFMLNDSVYQLTKNAGENTIHGGTNGFRVKVWDAKQLDDQNLELSYFSPNGEEGFPGNLTVKVLFTVTEENELKLTYHAKTDKPTIINLTNHWFTNLGGHGSGDILNHELLVNADSYTVADSFSIPTGEILPVEGTPLDFREITRIGARIDDEFDQTMMTKGYDQNLVISKGENELAFAALLHDPVSGRVMEVMTTEPGIQVYTANNLSGKPNETGKGGIGYISRSSICLETQHFPDSPNHPNFPSTVLNPGQDYVSTTIYKFGVKEKD
ncbi:MAG: aldose epimerase family protein [Cyclobacteriaceae bacterium]|nr:aldose epimerase family protein [Cyclobacteriaceae bacterium]